MGVGHPFYGPSSSLEPTVLAERTGVVRYRIQRKRVLARRVEKTPGTVRKWWLSSGYGRPRQGMSTSASPVCHIYGSFRQKGLLDLLAYGLYDGKQNRQLSSGGTFFEASLGGRPGGSRVCPICWGQGSSFVTRVQRLHVFAVGARLVHGRNASYPWPPSQIVRGA